MSTLIGRSHVILELRSRITRLAQTSFTVLIEGESGVGKELVAREIHDQSARRHGPFVPLNCAAIVETLLEAELFGIEERTATGVRGRRGKFEQAHRGTLFLDEVGDLSPAAQAKLLRVLQDLAVERVGGSASYQVDTRVIAATNRGLLALVEKGRFRSDLYYRLAGVDVHVAPLRVRSEDIPLLAEHFLRRHERDLDLTLEPGVVEALMTYHWPGNVRQLERVIESAVALSAGPSITLDDLPSAVVQGYKALVPTVSAQDDSLRAWSSRYVHLVLARCHGNKRRACEVLRISYHTLQAHLRYRVTADSNGSDGGDERGEVPAERGRRRPESRMSDAGPPQSRHGLAYPEQSSGGV